MAKSIKLGIDFGITNTDVVISKNSKLDFRTFDSKGAAFGFLKEIVDSCVSEVGDLIKIGVTGGKHLDLPSCYDDIKLITLMRSMPLLMEQVFSINLKKPLSW